jgi:hypothetical protein
MITENHPGTLMASSTLYRQSNSSHSTPHHPSYPLLLFLDSVIGPWLFTRRLLPLLKSTAQQPGSDVRVVTLGSGAHKFPSAADADYTSKEKWNKTFDKTLVKSMSRYGALHST